MKFVVFQLQLTLKIHHIRGFRRQQIDQITTEHIFLVQFLIEHPQDLRNIAVPLNEIAHLTAELIPLVGRFLIVTVCHRLQHTGHSSHRTGILPSGAEILLGKSLNVCIVIDRKSPQLLLRLIDQVSVDLLRKRGFLIERLKCLQNVLFLVGKIENESIHLAGAGAI